MQNIFLLAGKSKQIEILAGMIKELQLKLSCCQNFSQISFKSWIFLSLCPFFSKINLKVRQIIGFLSIFWHFGWNFEILAGMIFLLIAGFLPLLNFSAEVFQLSQISLTKSRSIFSHQVVKYKHMPWTWSICKGKIFCCLSLLIEWA